MNLEDISEQIKDLDKKVDAIREWKAALDQRCQNHDKDYDMVKDSLWGNPHGLQRQVAELISSRNNISRRRDYIYAGAQMIVVALIVAFVYWLISLGSN